MNHKTQKYKSLGHIGVAIVTLCALGAVGCNRSPEARMAKFMEAGRKLAAQKDYRAAVLQFRNASQAMPKNAEPYYQAGLAYIALRDFANAVPSLRKALALDPKHTGAQLALAEFETATSDRSTVEQAQKQLQDLLTTAPDNPEVLTTLAVAEWKLAEPAEAEKHLQEAFEKFPNNLTAAVSLAKLKMSKGDLDGAEDILKKTAAQAPPNADAVALLGAFYAIRKNDAEAESQFRRSLQINPNNATALLDLAALEIRQGKRDQAEQNYQQLSKARPEYRFVYGSFLMQVGKTDAAVAEYQRLYAASPKDRDARTRLVSVLFAANRPQEAEKILSDAIKKNPRDTDVMLQRSRLYIDSHRFADARRDLTEVMRNQNSGTVQYLLSRVDDAEGNQLARRDHLNEALRLQPTLLAARLELADLLLHSNSAKLALSLMDDTPKQQRGLTEAVSMRNWTLIASGDTAEARKSLEAAITHSRAPQLLAQAALFKIEDKEYDEARTLVKEGLAKSPDNRNLLAAMVQSYRAQNKLPAGVQEIRNYAASRPQSPAVQMFLGTLLRSTGDREGAAAAYAAAKAANPKDVRPDLEIARLYVEEGKPDDSIRSLNAVLAADPRNRTALLWRGGLEVKKTDYNGAVADFRRVLEVDSENKVALNNLGFLLSEYLYQPDEGLKYAQKALELNPSDPSTEDTLGWVLYRKGLYDLAVKQLEAAAQHPGNPVWKYHLAMVYAKLGRTSEARDAFDAGRQLNANIPEAKEARELLTQVQR